MKRSNWSSLITTLNELTHTGKLDWARYDPPDSLVSGTNHKVFGFYSTRFKDHRIGIYEMRHQVYSGEFDQLYWESNVQLDIFTEDFESLVAAPADVGVNDLYDTIKRKEAKLDDLFKGLDELEQK
ncbi:MAG TPA: hypothetical protein VGG19_05175 [Tepidisphaeraceae bacterium]